MTPNVGAVRMMTSTPEVRVEADGRRTLHGVFTPFNKWATIDSWEGLFRERTVPGAFKRTIEHSWDAFKRAGRHSIVVNYNHGFDPQIGDKQLGQIRVLEERKLGPYYEVALLQSEFNQDYIVPAAEDGLLGASYRFSIPKGGDSWDHETKDKIPERTITEARVFEFGPVDHPAFEAASAGVRTVADYEWWRALDDEGRSQYLALFSKAHLLGTSIPELREVMESAKDAEPEPVVDTSEEAIDSPPALAPVEARRQKADAAVDLVDRVFGALGLDKRK